MMRIMKFAVVCFVVLGMAGVVIPAYAEGKAAEMLVVEKTVERAVEKDIAVSGEVVSVDIEKSEVVVKQADDAVAGAFKDTTITVGPETKVLKGEVALQLSDLKAGDKVVIAFASDAQGSQKAKSIEVIVE